MKNSSKSSPYLDVQKMPGKDLEMVIKTNLKPLDIIVR